MINVEQPPPIVDICGLQAERSGIRQREIRLNHTLDLPVAIEWVELSCVLAVYLNRCSKMIADLMNDRALSSQIYSSSRIGSTAIRCEEGRSQVPILTIHLKNNDQTALQKQIQSPVEWLPTLGFPTITYPILGIASNQFGQTSCCREKIAGERDLDICKSERDVVETENRFKLRSKLSLHRIVVQHVTANKMLKGWPVKEDIARLAKNEWKTRGRTTLRTL